MVQREGGETVNNQVLIASIRERIINQINPDLLLLFGSRARGDESEESDVDLLLVMPTNCKPVERTLPIRRALRGISVGKDIVVYTPEEFKAWKNASLSLVSRALKEGTVLYQRSTHEKQL